MLRLGHESSNAASGWAVQWRLRRNCCLAPCQLLIGYASLCVVSLGVASAFWWAGARLVMPFAWLELLAVGAALLAYARHALDGETIALSGDRLTVEHASGSLLERSEFPARSVRVGTGADALVMLSGEGRRVEVGRYLRPELRGQLADELRTALRRVPHGTDDGRGTSDGTRN